MGLTITQAGAAGATDLLPFQRGDLCGSQCCHDWEEAARAGHVECLVCLQRAGQFLDLASPGRAAAGEARRAEAWLAAVVACRAGHAAVLEWLFQAGWPSAVDAALPFHLRDLAQSPGSGLWSLLAVKPTSDHVDVRKRGPDCLVEGALYRAAVLQPTVRCLEALLATGCRSPWIPFLACVEERMEHLEAALRRGCEWRVSDICDVVGQLGSLPILAALHEHVLSKTLPPMHLCQTVLEYDCEWVPALVMLPESAARRSHAAVLSELHRK